MKKTDLKTKTQSARWELTRISQDFAFQIGRTRVAHVDVLRALLDELIDNPSLRDIVRDRIETALAEH